MPLWHVFLESWKSAIFSQTVEGTCSWDSLVVCIGLGWVYFCRLMDRDFPQTQCPECTFLLTWLCFLFGSFRVWLNLIGFWANQPIGCFEFIMKFVRRYSWVFAWIRITFLRNSWWFPATFKNNQRSGLMELWGVRVREFLDLH